jgi:hypothetical protein
MKEPNRTLRFLALDTILNSQKQVRREQLASEFVPAVLRELAEGWTATNCWPLARFSSIVRCLMDRDLVQEEHVEALHKFFDVILLRERRLPSSRAMPTSGRPPVPTWQ